VGKAFEMTGERREGERYPSSVMAPAPPDAPGRPRLSARVRARAAPEGIAGESVEGRNTLGPALGLTAAACTVEMNA
jgi:hypothetical protein